MAMMMVLKVHMRCGKCRTDALLQLKPTELQPRCWIEKLIVEGHGVEIDELVRTLKKKVGYTQILFVNDL